MVDETLTPEDERLLDLLVDGELSETQRRELLLRIERAPDGWRRCALAFLEAQAWRGEAKSLVTEPVAVSPAAAVMPARSTSAWRSPVLWWPLTTAATLLVGWFSVIAIQSEQMKVVSEKKHPDGGSVTIVDNSPQPAPQPQFVEVQPQQAPQPQPQLAGQQNLRLVVRGPNGEAQILEVPLVGMQNMNEALLGQWSQMLTPELEQLLEASGNQIVRRRQLVPVDLNDGRRVVVPMEQVEIVPVSNRFQ